MAFGNADLYPLPKHISVVKLKYDYLIITTQNFLFWSMFKLGLGFFQIEQKLQDNGRYNEGLVLDLHIGQRVDNIREDIQAWFQGTNDGDNQGKQENDESSQGKSVGKHLSFVQDGTEKGKGPN